MGSDGSMRRNDAINICRKDPSCHMFYDRRGKGYDFISCNAAASVEYTGSGTVLYRNGNFREIRFI